MGNIVAKFDIDKLFAGVYEAVDIITATVVDAMQMACLEVTQNAKQAICIASTTVAVMMSTAS